MAFDKERALALIKKLDRALGKKESALPPERVHLIRTSARRVEALLKNAEPDKHRKLRKRLKSLRREAGAVRDLDVQMVALTDVNVEGDEEQKSRLMQALAHSRDQRAQELNDTLKGKKIRKVRTRLRRWSAEMDDRTDASYNLDPIPKALTMFASLSREVRGWSDENLHSYRTRCKRIRYLAEMAGDTPAANRIVEPLQRIQDAVGEWHDWQTLTQAAEKNLAGFTANALLTNLRKVTEEKFLAARKVCQQSRKRLLAQYREMLKRKREAKAAPKRKPKSAAVPATRAAVA